MIREEERIKGGGKWVLEQVCVSRRERERERERGKKERKEKRKGRRERERII